MNAKVVDITDIPRREPMDVAAIRLPREVMTASKKMAKTSKCRLADLFRAAIRAFLEDKGAIAPSTEVTR